MLGREIAKISLDQDNRSFLAIFAIIQISGLAVAVSVLFTFTLMILGTIVFCHWTRQEEIRIDILTVDLIEDPVPVLIDVIKRSGRHPTTLLKSLFDIFPSADQRVNAIVDHWLDKESGK